MLARAQAEAPVARLAGVSRPGRAPASPSPLQADQPFEACHHHPFRRRQLPRTDTTSPPDRYPPTAKMYGAPPPPASPVLTMRQGGPSRNHRQGLHLDRGVQSRHARRDGPQGRRRQDQIAQQAHAHGVLGRGRRHSSVRRIHPGQRPTLLDAQQHGSLPGGSRKLCPRRTGVVPPLAQALQCEPPPGRRRPHHPQAQPLLAGLPRVAGAAALCRPRLRPVCVSLPS